MSVTGAGHVAGATAHRALGTFTQSVSGCSPLLSEQVREFGRTLGMLAFTAATAFAQAPASPGRRNREVPVSPPRAPGQTPLPP